MINLRMAAAGRYFPRCAAKAIPPAILSPRYRELRAKGEKLLRDAYGISEPTACQIDALITKSWWLISDEVFDEFITESRDRPEVKLPEPPLYD
jgi:hypothetical protein